MFLNEFASAFKADSSWDNLPFTDFKTSFSAQDEQELLELMLI